MSEKQKRESHSSVADPQQWSLPDPKNDIAALNSKKQSATAERSQGSHWVFSKKIIPVDLYAYLTLRFGPPNGFAMTLRTPSVDNIVHWHYTVECPASVIDLNGMDTEINAHVHRVEVKESAWRKLESTLLSEFEANSKALAGIKNQFEKWQLFVNPYRRLTSIVDQFESKLKQIDVKAPDPPTFPAGRSELTQFYEEMGRAFDLQREALALCVSLEMILPVMGEAAVNLLMLLLAKADLRNDKRLMEKFGRDPIDVRIKSLHLHCDGFKTSIPSSDDRLKDFLRLMNRRNDTLHGNINPNKNFGEVIYFDQRNIPLPEEQNSFTEITLKHMLADLSKEGSLSSIGVVRRFVQLLIDSLQPEAKELVQHIMNVPVLGREVKTGRIGSILPTARVAVFLGRK